MTAPRLTLTEETRLKDWLALRTPLDVETTVAVSKAAKRLDDLEALLAELAKLPSPIHADTDMATFDEWCCSWCSAAWGESQGDYYHHPDNGCVYVRLRQAVQP